ncbi:hypothetical protein MGG_10420 [Pyricularia oryzae 70-15]|uniref:Orc1-like AAA ATPase domain-containing protein n=3 Tax=Pyricularia oryzae TaxID=318829 RepID=G4NGB3_PYRO7|nr:uncharacterized protein MGG_10420 [Pyricularia oryzae 70-15]EHA47070.1 hypothetical protein MGG_10420 [Pyricularia oryzae 70-15]ELQ40535.1 hypothetical protein OOU_Y34scaffold00427g6 [Pyricularia oryzae Y34]KAI7913925.1 hypothetical protein M0657_009770 [Pyricularia oryzae]KAI7914657.1 hypothetical protein M9X92_008888 [Pyricularia oryzae]
MLRRSFPRCHRSPSLVLCGGPSSIVPLLNDADGRGSALRQGLKTTRRRDGARCSASNKRHFQPSSLWSKTSRGLERQAHRQLKYGEFPAVACGSPAPSTLAWADVPNAERVSNAAFDFAPEIRRSSGLSSASRGRPGHYRSPFATARHQQHKIIISQRHYSSQPDASNSSKDAPPPLHLAHRMAEAAATSFASIVVLAVGFAIAGYAYHKSYKAIVLKKMANAFEPGDPVLELAAMGKGMPYPLIHGHHPDGSEVGSHHWVARPEQERVDAIVSGRISGHYHLLIGEKGTGKTSMLLEGMRKIDGEGIAMLDCHADLELFRIRLGKALDYEYHEDYIGGYFNERGPRDTTALLDIERALNKLEKVAMNRRKTKPGRPLVLIINQMHLLRDDEDGKDLLELLQQRAEQWAAANLVTMVFNSDDYWVYERFKQLATRMEVLAVQDLPKAQATDALKKYRRRYHAQEIDDATADSIYGQVGGRLTFLHRVAKSKNMLETCRKLIQIEKTWFLNQCWILGSTMDDDVMDQQKWAAAAMVLALALVDKESEMERTYDPVKGHMLPSFPVHEAQEIMTRADFVRDFDRRNLFAITSNADVRASSVPMHIAFKEICSQPGFREHLEATNKRIADIESLGRTRELQAKDLFLGGKYEITQNKGMTVVELKGIQPDGSPDDPDDAASS